ncbi:hypothetical protein ERJ75_001094800 [Trypanosoma vivax]|nr:hypothetical protein ERJ75_001094800 [Trypanosoma vivax]
MLLRGCVPLPRYGRSDSARTGFPCGGLAASVLAKRWPQPRTAWLEWLALFFLAFAWLASLLCQRRFCEDGHDTRRVAACAFFTRGCDGEAAIDNKAGVTEADAVCSASCRAHSREARGRRRWTRARVYLMSPSPHTALGPMSRKARSQRSLRCQRARSKKQWRRTSAQRTHWRALKGRRRAAALAKAIATSATEAATLSAHIAGEMDQWTRIASTLVSKARRLPVHHHEPNTTPAPSLKQKLGCSERGTVGRGQLRQPVPAECDADPTGKCRRGVVACHKRDRPSGGRDPEKFTIGTPTSSSQTAAR